MCIESGRKINNIKNRQDKHKSKMVKSQKDDILLGNEERNEGNNVQRACSHC